MRIKKIRQSLGAIGNVADSYTTDSNACYNAPYVNSLQPTVLWTNPNPLVAFEAQSITLSDSIANYQYYEIIYIAYANNSLSQDTFLSTGKVFGERTRLFYVDNYNRTRVVYGVSGTNVTFDVGGSYTSYGAQTLSPLNSICVPYKILGYK